MDRRVAADDPYLRAHRGHERPVAARLARRRDAVADAAGKRLAAQQGADPNAWRASEAKELITLAPLPLMTMQYTNKPSGIHQVMQFGP